MHFLLQKLTFRFIDRFLSSVCTRTWLWIKIWTPTIIIKKCRNYFIWWATELVMGRNPVSTFLAVFPKWIDTSQRKPEPFPRRPHQFDSKGIKWNALISNTSNFKSNQRIPTYIMCMWDYWLPQINCTKLNLCFPFRILINSQITHKSFVSPLCTD
jgi:hypothetical protein